MKKEFILEILLMAKQMDKVLSKILKVEVFSKELGKKEEWLAVQ